MSVSVCVSVPALAPPLALPQISGLTSRPLIRLFLASPFRVANRWGALLARPPTPANTARGAGRGGGRTPALPIPSRPLWPTSSGWGRVGGRRGWGTGVSTGSVRPSRLRAPRHLSPCPSTEPGSGPDLGPGLVPGP